MTRMKAAVCERYGPPEVLRIAEVEAPVRGDDEILVRVHASTVNSSDWYVRSGVSTAPLAVQVPFRLMVGIRRPRRRIIGLILAGDVVEVGRKVTRFHPGDRAWAFTKFRFGAYAEYASLAEESSVALAPAHATDEEAAAIAYGGLMALHYLRKGGVRAGQRVLVYGASGAAGTAIVQLARHAGAEVTAVCGPGNVELVRSLGAGAVLDYTTTAAPPDGATWDVVIDAVGKRRGSPLKDACRRALASGGTYVSVDDGTPGYTADDLATLAGLVESGAIRAVIDRTYPLERIAEAHRYVEADHKRGNVVVSIA
jgi:NADPH:quinone reductase-like Zn-dependent oxidoreductase